MPHISTPPHHSLYRRGRGIDRRSDIEVKDRFARRFRVARVVVDDVTDFFGFARRGATGDVPVVAVEGGLAARKGR